MRNADTIFRVITVYGSPYDEGKESFISELHSLILEDPFPTLIGGGLIWLDMPKIKVMATLTKGGVIAIMPGLKSGACLRSSYPAGNSPGLTTKWT